MAPLAKDGRHPRGIAAALASVVFLCPPTLVAEDGAPDTSGRDTPTNSGWAVEVAPPANFYPHYIADPIRAQSALFIGSVLDTEIPQVGDARFDLRLGGRFAILRLHPSGRPEVGWQLDFEGGFFGHFDVDSSVDNVGWDGIYGLLVSWKPSPRLGLRFGVLHDSAHVGDEYSERTGRRRIGYTRQEVVAGVSYQFRPHWRTYGELGASYGLEEFQEPLRAQAGLEYLGTRRVLLDRMSWYAALDLRAYAENDWDIRSTVQLGLLLPFRSGTSRYRVAIEAGTGRTALGEFFFREESYIGIGWYFDF
jgi:hypothetical protein